MWYSYSVLCSVSYNMRINISLHRERLNSQWVAPKLWPWGVTKLWSNRSKMVQSLKPDFHSWEKHQWYAAGAGFRVILPGAGLLQLISSRWCPEFSFWSLWSWQGKHSTQTVGEGRNPSADPLPLIPITATHFSHAAPAWPHWLSHCCKDRVWWWNIFLAVRNRIPCRLHQEISTA